MTRVTRYDRNELGRATRTPQGFLRIPAYLTRAGIFEYRRADGSIVRELRPADEVFKAESMATLQTAPVTQGHPGEMVTPHNIRRHAIGRVGERFDRDRDFLSAQVVVEDADAIAAVERGDLREISCGYQCRIDPTPGTYEGKAYDQVQRDIVYNHAALGPRGWGRAGVDVALRLDSSSAISTELIGEGEQRMDMVTVKIGGRDVQMPRDAAEALEGEALKARVRKLVGDALRLDEHRTRRAIKEAVLKHFDPKADIAGKSDAYIDGLFDAVVEPRERAASAGVRSDGLAARSGVGFPSSGVGRISLAINATAGATPPAAARRDAYEPVQVDRAQEALTAWRLPLAVSKDRPGYDGTASSLERDAYMPEGFRDARRPTAGPLPSWMQPLAVSKDR